jgi:hypothetical protein
MANQTQKQTDSPAAIVWGQDEKLAAIAQLEIEAAAAAKAAAEAEAKRKQALATAKEIATAEQRERLGMLCELLTAERIAPRVAPLITQHLEARRACAALYHAYRAELAQLNELVREADRIARQLEPESLHTHDHTVRHLLQRIVRESEQAMRAEAKTELDVAAVRFALDATGVHY